MQRGFTLDLIPQGEHLTKRRSQSAPRQEAAVGWCPKAGRNALAYGEITFATMDFTGVPQTERKHYPDEHWDLRPSSP
jgi:hypothetical protein